MNIDESNKQRFLDKYVPEPNTGCWLWTGAIAKLGSGYGIFSVKKNGKRVKTGNSHRFSWIIHHGSIPNGLLVCHKCDTPACVNPDHLFLGTQTDNIRDCKNKKRQNLRGLKLGHDYRWIKKNSHCRQGHEFVDENSYIVNKSGFRICRACARIRSKEFQRKKRLKATHCKNGHEFTPGNTVIQKTGKFCRVCRDKKFLTFEENKKKYWMNLEKGRV